MIKKLWPRFKRINDILKTYVSDDKDINEVKGHLEFITMILFNKDFKIQYKKCPCKEVCQF